MADHIERDCAIAIIDNAAELHPYSKDRSSPETYSEFNNGWESACDYILSRLETAKTTVDAVPVVRCRECKYYYPSKVRYLYCAYPGGMLCPPDANGFCSYGQRKGQSDTIGKSEAAF